MENGSDEFDFYIDKAGRTIPRSQDTKDVQESPTDSYAILTDPYERKLLASEMASFVHARATEQQESMNVVNNRTLVFLDKSARPAAWLFRDMWKALYPHIASPDIKFVNIGQEKSPDPYEFIAVGALEPDMEKFYEKTKANTKMVDNLRKVFQIKPTAAAGESADDISKTHLDGKDVLIVDEHSNTGTSLVVARALFDGAFGDRINSLNATDIFSTEPPWLWDEDAIGVRDGKPGDFTTRRIQPISDDTHQLNHELKMLVKEYISGDAA